MKKWKASLILCVLVLLFSGITVQARSVYSLKNIGISYKTGKWGACSNGTNGCKLVQVRSIKNGRVYWKQVKTFLGENGNICYTGYGKIKSAKLSGSVKCYVGDCRDYVKNYQIGQKTGNVMYFHKVSKSGISKNGDKFGYIKIKNGKVKTIVCGFRVAG